jgi:transmembrane sensor
VTGPQGLALAACLLLMVVASSVWLAARPGSFSTAVGEQQMATLEDGTRITLNTDTRLRVRYADHQRSVMIDRGEAMFEVAPNPRRPFVVTAGGTKVRALGTSFIVRRVGGNVVVTLVQGKVSVTDAASGPGGAAKAANEAILAPGERLIVTDNAMTQIDRPSIEAVTAWRRGQAIFADTPLSAAVAELNRYGGPHVVLGDPRLASLRVSGVFATNDTVEFATAVAALHGLEVERGRDEVAIVR